MFSIYDHILLSQIAERKLNTKHSVMFRGRRRGQNYGVFLLFMQLMNYGFNRIPPVTLVAILGQVAIFLGFGDLDRWFGSVQDVCISTHLVLRQKQWTRLILGALLYADDMHLYFNMISLLWKGVTLEKKFKSQYFGFLLAVFTVLTSVTLVLLNWVISEFTRDRSYGLTCAVGFSGNVHVQATLEDHLSILVSLMKNEVKKKKFDIFIVSSIRKKQSKVICVISN